MIAKRSWPRPYFPLVRRDQRNFLLQHMLTGTQFSCTEPPLPGALAAVKPHNFAFSMLQSQSEKRKALSSMAFTVIMGKKPSPTQPTTKRVTLNTWMSSGISGDSNRTGYPVPLPLQKTNTGLNAQHLLAADSKIKYNDDIFPKVLVTLRRNLFLAQVSGTGIAVWFCSKPVSMGAKFWLTATLQFAGNPVSGEN